MKRAMALALALILTLALLPAAIAAAAGPALALEKTVYRPNESVKVFVTGITEQMVSEGAWLGLFKAGTGHQDYMNYTYPDADPYEASFNAPTEPGPYEIRLFAKDDGGYSESDLIAKVVFTVSLHDLQGSIALEKTAYLARQPILVTVTGITEDMVKAGAYVGIYPKGAPHSAFAAYEYVKAGNSTVELTAPNQNGEFEVRLYGVDRTYTDEALVMSVPFTLSGAVQASDWAVAEIAKADELGLIPDSLKTADLTKPITRAEFAAVSVKLYEKLSGNAAQLPATNPFTDTNDPEVLKAYHTGITAGVAADRFAPTDLLNREQAATMLTRVFKKAYVEGWTLEDDGKFTFNYDAPPKFADDARISDWAKPSVYFMVAHGIISGVGNNEFAPRAVTTAEQAMNYAVATREQALAIAVRMVEKLDPAAASQIVPVNP